MKDEQTPYLGSLDGIQVDAREQESEPDLDASVAYPIHTPRAYWFVLGMITAFSVLSLGAMRMLDIPLNTSTSFVFVLLAALPFVYVPLTQEYRVEGTLRLTREFVEVTTKNAPVQTFLVEDSSIERDPPSARSSMLRTLLGGRGQILTFQNREERFQVSTLTLVERDREEALLADLDRIARGFAPSGRAPTDRPNKAS